MGKNVSDRTLKYIRVTRGEKKLKVFMKDVAVVYIRKRLMNKPPVPSF